MRCPSWLKYLTCLQITFLINEGRVEGGGGRREEGDIFLNGLFGILFQWIVHVLKFF